MRSTIAILPSIAIAFCFQFQFFARFQFRPRSRSTFFESSFSSLLSKWNIIQSFPDLWHDETGAFERPVLACSPCKTCWCWCWCWWSPFIRAEVIFISAVYLTLGRLSWLLFEPQLSHWRSHNSCANAISPWSPYQNFTSVVKWCLPTIHPHINLLPYPDLLSVDLTGRGPAFF